MDQETFNERAEELQTSRDEAMEKARRATELALEAFDFSDPSEPAAHLREAAMLTEQAERDQRSLDDLPLPA